MKKYQPKEIESKWQKRWTEANIYHTDNSSTLPKKYILDMFPYPSGEGLHVGHFKGYVASDVISRYYRFKKFNVLHPMGWDAFGLPAENYAIKTGIHPSITTKKNISVIKQQMQITGLSYDWNREIDTTDPNYYRFTQWIFIKLFENGLAYEAEMPINFCPSCKTGLANEEVVGGRCERCGTEVIRKPLRQWVLRITKYADRLLEDLEELNWPEFIKEMQVNWIGRSEGTQVRFDIVDRGYSIEAFTTRIDTIYGVTALILAPEHEKVRDLITPENKQAVEQYLKVVKNKSDLERTSLNKEKTGVFTGSYAVNPLSGDKIPIWIADYILGFYGTGAVMMVPAHDKRDEEFAKKYNIEIVPVIDPESGRLINSGQLDGMPAEAAKKELTEILRKQDYGDFKVEYKLRDWGFSRQRYWGEPIPIIHCEKCGTVTVPENDLPLKLPEVEKYEPTGTGESPLAQVIDWVNTTCPKCKGPAKRETNTMPQWAGSCWYYLRFCDPENNKALVNKEIEKYWIPVDWYIGGAEHAVLHLLYSRFWHKFLFDIEVISTKEPFQKLSSVGLVLADDGRKMSKSLGNVITPNEIVDEYGADTLRVYECFMGPFENTISWDPTSIHGVYRFLTRIWEIINNPTIESSDSKIDAALYKLISKVESDIENMKFNTSIAAMMEFVNFTYHKQLTLEQKKTFLILLSPFAPHMTEELWEMLNSSRLVSSQFTESKTNTSSALTMNNEPITNNSWSIHQQSWPEVDKKYLVEEYITIIIQINGKVRDQINVPSEVATNQEEIEKLSKATPKAKKFLEGQEIKKVVYIPGKILSFSLASK